MDSNMHANDTSMYSIMRRTSVPVPETLDPKGWPRFSPSRNSYLVMPCSTCHNSSSVDPFCMHDISKCSSWCALHFVPLCHACLSPSWCPNCWCKSAISSLLNILKRSMDLTVDTWIHGNKITAVTDLAKLPSPWNNKHHLAVGMLVLSCIALWWVHQAHQDAFILLFLPCSVFCCPLRIHQVTMLQHSNVATKHMAVIYRRCLTKDEHWATARSHHSRFKQAWQKCKDNRFMSTLTRIKLSTTLRTLQARWPYPRNHFYLCFASCSFYCYAALPGKQNKNDTNLRLTAW